MINSTQLHLKKRACGDISAKLYYVTSCFKVKCPLSDPKSNFKISQKHMKHNSFVTYYKLKWRRWLLMFNSGLKIKHDAKQTKGTPQVRGDKLAFKNAWYYWLFLHCKNKTHQLYKCQKKWYYAWYSVPLISEMMTTTLNANIKQ